MNRLFSEESDRLSESSSRLSKDATRDEDDEEGDEEEEEKQDEEPEAPVIPRVKEKEPGKFMLDFDDRAEEHKQFLQEFFQKEQCLYTHRAFRFAANVYQSVKHQRMKMSEKAGKKGGKETTMEFPNIEFKDSNEKRLTFGLVFSTLKC